MSTAEAVIAFRMQNGQLITIKCTVLFLKMYFYCIWVCWQKNAKFLGWCRQWGVFFIKKTTTLMAGAVMPLLFNLNKVCFQFPSDGSIYYYQMTDSHCKNLAAFRSVIFLIKLAVNCLNSKGWQTSTQMPRISTASQCSCHRAFMISISSDTLQFFYFVSDVDLEL